MAPSTATLGDQERKDILELDELSDALKAKFEKVAPSGDEIQLALVNSIRAGPWSEPDHIYEAPCGCRYVLRAHGRGEGWDAVCPSHRGQIRYVESPEAKDLLPYGCSVADYLAENQSAAFIAFQEGDEWVPSTYEYGTNAGDYSSPLVSEGGKLWYYLVRQECATKRAVIAVREVA